jgi:transglutaminase-like putative cysteine protease
VLRDLVAVRRALAAHPLPVAIEVTGRVQQSAGDPWPVPRLRRAVDRCLLRRPLRARCLVRAMVLYRLLRRQGLPAQVVIGLAPSATSTDAHAWVEVEGRDVGPYPGRSGNDELARYS